MRAVLGASVIHHDLMHISVHMIYHPDTPLHHALLLLKFNAVTNVSFVLQHAMVNAPHNASGVTHFSSLGLVN